MSSYFQPWNWPPRAKLHFSLSATLCACAAWLLWDGGPGASFGSGFALAVAGIVFAEGVFRLTILDETPANHQDKMLAMLASARNRVVATSGTFDADSWVNWRDGAVPRMLASKASEGVHFELLCQELDPRSVDTFHQLCGSYPDHIHLYVNAAVNPTPHGLLIDSSALRIERPHEKNSSQRANAFLRNPTVGVNVFLDSVEDYRERARKLEVGVETLYSVQSVVSVDIT